LEEARAAWRKAILSAHPDKRAEDEVDGSSDVVTRLQWAWEVVSAALAARGGGAEAPVTEAVGEAAVAVADDLDSGDMEVTADEGGGVLLSSRCRCGEAYTISQEEMLAVPVGSSVILPCSGCSLHVRVTRTVP